MDEVILKAVERNPANGNLGCPQRFSQTLQASKRSRERSSSSSSTEMQVMQLFRIPYARHYKPRLVYFYPIFKDQIFVFKEDFSESFVLMYDLYSRAACNQERLMMASASRYILHYLAHNEDGWQTFRGHNR